jgi:hypothetical protein
VLTGNVFKRGLRSGGEAGISKCVLGPEASWVREGRRCLCVFMITGLEEVKVEVRSWRGERLLYMLLLSVTLAGEVDGSFSVTVLDDQGGSLVYRIGVQ